MLIFWHKFAEEQIQKAMERGEFDNLAGKGKPLQLEDDSMIPEDCRMAYKILKNSGYAPQEISESKEIHSVLDLLENCSDEKERYQQIQKLNYLVMKANMRRRRALDLEQYEDYYQRIVEQIQVKKP